MTTNYPQAARDRDRWIVARRGARHLTDASRPYAVLMEHERTPSGEVAPTAVIFLTNRECPWRCLMCDLWKNALTETVRGGAIPAQIDHGLGELARQGRGDPRQIKLYNSGSFFDPRAIPPGDHEAIAGRLGGFERVIVECHPALVGASVLRFRDLLAAARTYGPGSSGAGREGGAGQLEVAMGLETAHPQVLEKLNKRMTLEQFQGAAEFLVENGIALRVFVLVKPPFLDEAGALHWARRSVDFAFDCGATAVSLIPTRPGNGALEALAARGEFAPPELGTLEAALDYGIGLRHGRVFADLWDLERFSACSSCFPARRARLSRMNLEQVVLPAVNCDGCA